MPALINIAANLIFGAALARMTKDSPHHREGFISWPLILLVAFESFLVTPVATYVFRFHPQWSLLYAFDPQVYGGLLSWVGVLSAGAVLLNYVCALWGFAATRVAMRKAWPWLAYIPWVMGVGIIAGVVWSYGSRILYLGEYDAFWHGRAQLFVTQPAGWVALLPYVFALPYLFWVKKRLA